MPRMQAPSTGDRQQGIANILPSSFVDSYVADVPTQQHVQSDPVANQQALKIPEPVVVKQAPPVVQSVAPQPAVVVQTQPLPAQPVASQPMVVPPSVSVQSTIASHKEAAPLPIGSSG